MIKNVQVRHRARRPAILGGIVGLIGLGLFLIGLWLISDGEAQALASRMPCDGHTACITTPAPAEVYYGQDAGIAGLGLMLGGPLVGGLLSVYRWHEDRG